MLGLAEPWKVTGVEFNADKKRLDIYLDFPKGNRFRCPECKELSGVYDSENKCWRNLYRISVPTKDLWKK